MPARLADKLYRVGLLLCVAYAVLACFGPVMDNVDLGWQVAQGRWMARHGALYSRDLLNYPAGGRAIVNEYPLFELVLDAAWSLGWLGPCLLAAAGYALLTGLLVRAAWQLEGARATAFLFALGLALLCINIESLLRPHLVTYVAITVLGLFLLRHRDDAVWWKFWPVALLQVAWTNCHSGFVIGPAMVGLFGAEAVLTRAARTRTFPAREAANWLGAFLLVSLACLVNPYGLERLQPVLTQGRLESIRAYVGEMEPIAPAVSHLYGLAALFIALLLLPSARRGLPWSFILLAALFFHESLDARKSWPIFGLLMPLVVLGAGREPASAQNLRAWRSVLLAAANFFVASIVAVETFALPQVLGIKWRELDRGHSEMAVDAARWMIGHQVTGRLFHRCEDGGLLQMSGYDQGETYADTGFGKYDAAFIHEVGLVNERPALLPVFLAKYRPDYVVCGNFCYEWPYFLRTAGWRLIYYSPNSQVWTRAGLRPDLPTVAPGQVEAAFTQDLRGNGGPRDARLLGRNLIALASLGLDDAVLRELAWLPPDAATSGWYWEAARLMCFGDGPGPAKLRDAFRRQAAALPDPALTEEFRAYDAYFVRHDAAAARAILQAMTAPSDPSAELLLRIELEQNDPAALQLARAPDFNLRNGRHWQYLAQAEEKWGSLDAARAAWRQAVFYYPDDPELMQAARDFAQRKHDAALAEEIAQSAR